MLLALSRGGEKQFTLNPHANFCENKKDLIIEHSIMINCKSSNNETF